MNKEPSDAQKSAGNYQKEHRFMHGMRLSIENKAGSKRKGVDPEGRAWESDMIHDYGYIRGTTGKDKDHIDAFLSDDADNPDHKVYVVDQNNKDGQFDEHKVMFGFPSSTDAYDAYHANYEPGWQGFDSITEMDMPTFKQWAYSGKSGKRKPVSQLNNFKAGGSICGCGDRPGMADGGSVDDEDLTKPAFRTPMIAKRREDRQDRTGATEMPLQALRGAVTGTLGFGGDMEGLGRSIANFLGADVDSTPALPTGDFYRDIAPLPPKSASGRAASGAGSALGMPMSGVALGAVRGAKAAAPAVRGALTQIAENAAAPRVLSSQAGAVKLPGGNWMNEFGKSNIVEDLQGSAFDPAAKQWVEKKLGKYIANDLGTANDPLLALEKQGITHIPDLAERADVRVSPMKQKIHEELTGRTEKTPWERLSDTQIEPYNYDDMAEVYGDNGLPLAPWTQGESGKAATYYDINPNADRTLGFDHIIDYLNSALETGNAVKIYGRGEFGGVDGQQMNRMIGRNLDIDPDKLSKMSMPEIVAKVSDWDKMMADARRLENINKGVKGTLKQYSPEEGGMRWVELDKDALADESCAMGHCVGQPGQGYGERVEKGTGRILSLRDAEGQPHVTVELKKGYPRDPAGYYADNSQDIDKLAQEMMADNSWKGDLDDATQWAAERHYQDNSPWEINQIKGKGNRKQIDKYTPAVQDLVRNMGPWGDRIGDFGNTGLINTKDFPYDPAYLKNHYGISNQAKPGMYTPEELAKAFSDANPDVETKAFTDMLIGSSRGNFAVGGSIGAGDTVGLGQFAQGGGSQSVATPAPVSTGGWSAGAPVAAAPPPSAGPNLANAGYGGYNSPYGQVINGGQPVNNGKLDKNNAPTYSTNGLDAYFSGDPSRTAEALQMDPGLFWTLKSGNAGFINRGLGAVGGNTQPYYAEQMSSPGEYTIHDSTDRNLQLANQLGIDSGYGSAPIYGRNTDGQPYDIAAGKARADHIANTMNDQLKDYYSVSGMSSGWTGSDNMRGASQTLYKNVDGRLLPITRPRNYNAPETSGYLKHGAGAELKEMIMTIGPALLGGFGGWAGLLGQGASAYAPLINAAGNAVVGGAAGGTQGALSSLAGSAGGAAGGAAGGYFGNASAGSAVGSAAGKYFANNNR